jgi:transposase
VPAVPSCILDPLGEEFLALLPPRVDRHPLGCHRRRVDDRIVFDKLVEALVFGCGYERLGDACCSATTLRRRRDEWIAAGVFDALRRSVLAAYQRLIGLDLTDVCFAGCLTKAPGRGECAGRSSVDRGKSGLERSQLADGAGVPITALPAPATLAITSCCRPPSTSSPTCSPRSVPRPSGPPCTWMPAMTTGPAGPSWPHAASGRGSPAAGTRLRSRSASAG